MTIVTTILLGILYPLVVTGLAQVLFPKQANGELIEANGKLSARVFWDRVSPVPDIFIPGPLRLTTTPQIPTARS